MNNTALIRIGFGGGCHWCTEAVFLSLRGVALVEQGFICSTPPDDRPSEAVLVHFDVNTMDVETLIAVHLHTHSSTSAHPMRGKYRSAVYSFDNNQSAACEDALNQLQSDFAQPLVTRVMPFVSFRASEEKYQNYYYSNPQKPFCETWIHPKLQLIRNKFTDHELVRAVAITKPGRQ